MIEKLLHQKRIHNLEESISRSELKKLKQKMPIQKIIGFINFDNLQININKKVLIPRYETQEVVNFSLKFINSKSKVLDLCCGSGYIGLTLKQKTNADVTLSDVSNQAIKQSKLNAAFNNLNVKIIKSNLFKNINDKYDVIVCNPPYLNKKNINQIDDSVLKFEPHNALFAKNNGNYFYDLILKKVENFLTTNGVLIFEISHDNALFLKEKSFSILKDINGKERIAFKHF